MTRIGEILPLWQNIKSFWQYFDSLFSIWHTFEPTLINLVCFGQNFIAVNVEI